MPVLLGVALWWMSAAVSRAAEVEVAANRHAKFNLDGTVLGVYLDHTPLVVKGVLPGRHKLYVKSLDTGELKVFVFTVEPGRREPLSFYARFAPPERRADSKARRRTAIGAAALLNEVLGHKSEGRQDRRAVLVGAAVVNEVFTGKRHPRRYGEKYGNTLDIRANVPVDVNVDLTGARSFERGEPKVFHHLAAGSHKVFVRNKETGELKVFRIEFPAEGTRTITIKPAFAPPPGETVNAKARRRTVIAAGALANELKGGKKKSKRRKLALAAGLLNELIGTKAGRRRAPVVLDLDRLPMDRPMDLEEARRFERRRRAAAADSK